MTAAERCRHEARPTAQRDQHARRSHILLVAMLAILAYFMLPLFWLVIASTKTTSDLFSTFGLWFADEFSSARKRRATTLTHDDGIYLRWVAATPLAVRRRGAGGATALATLGGYGVRQVPVPGQRALFVIVLGAIAVPPTALAIPTYLLFARRADQHAVGRHPAVLVSPFGLFLMRVYAADAVPDELIEAAPHRRRRRGPDLLRRSRCGCLRRASSRCCCSRSWRPGTTTSCRSSCSTTRELYPITVGLSAMVRAGARRGGGASPSC